MKVIIATWGVQDMTKEERKEYMSAYRKANREQIKATTLKRNTKLAKDNIDHIETVGNLTRICTKDGRIFDFIRPFC